MIAKTAIMAGLTAWCAWTGTAWSAPITFNTALPVHEGGWVLREQFIYVKIADDPTPAERDMRVAGLMSVLGYGLTRNFALFGILPYVDKRLGMRAGGPEVTRREQGMGDFTLMGRYTAYESNALGRTFRVAPFLGMKAPTGRDDASDGMGRLPPQVQPGSGSWDGFGGAVVTWQTLEFQIDGQVSYRASGEADGFQAGDVAGFDASFQHRLWPRRLGEGVPAFLYGVLEVNLTHAARDRLGGATDPNSGGSQLFVSPGLQYVTRKYILEAGLQIPIVQDLNGTTIENDYGLNAGFRVNF